MSDERYYAVRMIWVRDQQAWDKYQEKAMPVLARHGVQMEQWLVTDTIHGEGVDKPDIVAVTSYPSAAAFEAFESDPDLEKASAVRDTGAKLVTVTGHSALP